MIHGTIGDEADMDDPVVTTAEAQAGGLPATPMLSFAAANPMLCDSSPPQLKSEQARCDKTAFTE